MILPESPTASDSKPYPPPPSLSLPPAAPSYHSHPHAHHSSTYPPASPSHYQHQHRSPSSNPFNQNEQEDEQIANAVFSPSYEAEVERAAEQEAIDSPPILLSAPDPPPGWSPPSLRRPIIIPEVTGQFGAPFSRCFPQILDLFQVNKAEFIDMIDRLNKVWAPSGVWNNLDVAANVIGLVPEVTFMVVGISLQVVAQTALRVSQTKATNAFLKRLNEEYWKKRGLRVKVVGSKKVKKLLGLKVWDDNIDFLPSPSSPSPSASFSNINQSLDGRRGGEITPTSSDQRRRPPPWHHDSAPPQMMGSSASVRRTEYEYGYGMEGTERSMERMSFSDSKHQEQAPPLPTRPSPRQPPSPSYYDQQQAYSQTNPRLSSFGQRSTSEKVSAAYYADWTSSASSSLPSSEGWNTNYTSAPGTTLSPRNTMEYVYPDEKKEMGGSGFMPPSPNTHNPSYQMRSPSPNPPRHPSSLSYTGSNASGSYTTSPPSSRDNSFGTSASPFGGSRHGGSFSHQTTYSSMTSVGSTSSFASSSSSSTQGGKDVNAWAKRRMAAIGDIVEPLDFDSIAPLPVKKENVGKKAVNKFEDLQLRALRQNFNGMQGRLEKRVAKAEEKLDLEENGKKREKLEKKAQKQRDKLNKRANKETEKLSWIVILPIADKDGWKILDK